MGKKRGWVAAFVIVAAALLSSVLGCSSANTVKDQDRVVVEYNRQMWAQVGVIASGLSGSAPDAAAALAVLAADGNALSAHLIGIWGAPKIAPPAYSTRNLKTAIDQSKAAHASIWLHPWALVGYGAMGLLTVLKIAGSFFPGIGTFLSSAAGRASELLGGALVNISHKAEDHPNDTIHIDDIKGELATIRTNPAVDTLLRDLHADKIVDKLLTITLPQQPAAAPAPAQPSPAAAPTA